MGYPTFRYTRKKTRSQIPLKCPNDMTFEDCELAILRQAVDYNEKHIKRDKANMPEIKKMITIVEQFLKDTKCICYGGTAINNILPEEAQFYDHDIEIPDYDFYSSDPIKHTKELSDIFSKAGYVEVEAKSGMHYGTYKVFVNFIPMADITEMNHELFSSLKKDAIIKNDVLYAPANFLRMSMYLELSRPQGDISRWEKVLKRLTLLNKYYPLTAGKCHQIDFQRKMDKNVDLSEKLYYTIRDTFIEQEVVFFGGYASSLYSRYMPLNQQHLVKSIPDFDVLSEEPEKCAEEIHKCIVGLKIREKVSILKHPAVGEIIPEHIEIRLGKTDSLAFIYKPIACHNYNKLELLNKTIRIATIDCMLSFYLAFLYSNKFIHNKERLLCMSQFLFEVEQKNRLAQKGLLKRFSIKCYGKQETLESIRAKKTEMYQKLKHDRNNPEYEKWFMKYNPSKTNTVSNKKSTKKHVSFQKLSETKVPHKQKTKKMIWNKKGFFQRFYTF